MLRSIIGMMTVLMLTSGVKAAALTVQVEGASSDRGPVLVGVCSGSLDFGSCRYSQTVQAPAAEFQVLFPDVPEGAYAIAAFQDVNGNSILDRDPRGLPLEPYGFSNGTGRTAPPSFEAARITVRGSTLTRVRLTRSPLAR